MNTQLDPFETALLARLRDHVEQTEPLPHDGSRRWPRRLTIAAVAAATVAAVAVGVPGTGTIPAYSVQEGNAGEIVVEVNRPEDATGLEKQLAEHGVRADITYVPDGDQCAPGRYRPVQRSLPGMAITIGRDRLTATLPPGAVREDETFVLAVSGTPIPAEPDASEDGIQSLEGFAAWTDFDVTPGPVQPCRIVPGDAG